MKLEKFFQAMCAFFVAFLLSFSCAACIASAFALDTAQLVSLDRLAIWCALFSFFAGFCFTYRLSFLVPIVMAAAGVLLWRYGELQLSLKGLINTFTSVYHKAYGWDIQTWDIVGLMRIDRTLALQAVATITAAAAAWTVGQRRSTFWALAGTLLPFLTCTLVLKTVPNEKYLFLWLFSLILLIITQPMRRIKASDANKLTALLLVPLFLATVALFAAFPHKTYSHRDTAEKILDKVEKFFDFKDDSAKLVGSTPAQRDQIDLSKVGFQALPYIPIMDVLATRTDQYYLRGRVYDTYKQTTWVASGQSYSLSWPSFDNTPDTLTIKMREVTDVIYVPLWQDPSLMLASDHTVLNKEDKLEFTYRVHQPQFMLGSYEEKASEIERLTALPDETAQWAQSLLADIAEVYPMQTEAQIVEALRYYFTTLNPKEYSLQTAAMPRDAKDFAQWFIESSKTGYCVHFATAGTVLLRAAGIPARYVTGYYFDAVDAEKEVVYLKDAHAWVEYWTSDYGWRILDLTPSDGDFDSRPDSRPEPTLPTKPTETTTQPTTTEKTIIKPTKDTASAGNENTAKTQASDPSLFLTIVTWLTLTMLLVGVIVAQSKLRIVVRKKLRKRGSFNQRALKAWKEVCRYASALKQPPDEALKELTLKARFSNHRITAEELRQYESAIRQSVEALSAKPWYLRFYHRLILALY